jgi:hypothetical protein
LRRIGTDHDRSAVAESEREVTGVEAVFVGDTRSDPLTRNDLCRRAGNTSVIAAGVILKNPSAGWNIDAADVLSMGCRQDR